MFVKVESIRILREKFKNIHESFAKHLVFFERKT